MTIIEAVRSVPHRPDCNVETAEEQDDMRDCTCDRDERIAKGIEAAIELAVTIGYHESNETIGPVVARFVEASSLDGR